MESNTQDNIQSTEIRMLKFKVGGNSFGIELNNINEILSYRHRPTSIPNSPSYVEGVMLLRKSLIAIVNLAEFMDLTIVEGREEKIIGINYKGKQVAFHVDEVTGIYNGELTSDYNKAEEANSEELEAIKRLKTYKNITLGYTSVNGEQFAILDLNNIIERINPTIL